jgi:hypothetical protein
VNDQEPPFGRLLSFKVTCGWLTHGRPLFFACPKKSHQKKRHPGAADIFLRFSGKSAAATGI